MSLQPQAVNTTYPFKLHGTPQPGKRLPEVSPRRRIQNRIAQRKFRERMASKKSTQDKSLARWDTDMREQDLAGINLSCVNDHLNDTDRLELTMSCAQLFDAPEMPVMTNVMPDSNYSSTPRQLISHYSTSSEAVGISSTLPSLATTPASLDYDVSHPHMLGCSTPGTQDATNVALDVGLGCLGPETDIEQGRTEHPRIQSSKALISPTWRSPDLHEAMRSTNRSSSGIPATRVYPQTSYEHSIELSSPSESSIQPLLHVAARSRNRRVMTTLLKHGAVQVDDQDSQGQTSLHIAAELGDEALVLLLLCHGADPHVCDNCGQSPLYLAVSGGHNEIVESLLEHGNGAKSRMVECADYM
ncbi:hypothetical protein F5B20DRAFT_595486 [Whalleya microplaca]|nr:hypothetical protein F5B20DRAFT_595486 [Whalleya microplaca]